MDIKNSKRDLTLSEVERQPKRIKTQKKWQTPKARTKPFVSRPSIEPGDSGIWVTCDMNKESKCVGELRNLFQEYTDKLYATESTELQNMRDLSASPDIQADIESELKNIRKSDSVSLITHVRSDIACVLFFKTRVPIEPVSFVRTICQDALDSGVKRTRHVRRLTPMALMGKATENGLEEICKIVLAPHFHQNEGVPKKFAIRPSIRNHGKGLTRDGVIRQIAAAVGPGHKVDLKNYDLLILVEICKNICGMSVVGADFDKLKRYNLAEIYQPSKTDNLP